MACGDHEWEKCKENIKPLKTGRRIGEVLAALNNDTSHANKMIEEFETQLRIMEGEELLEKWSEYINWTQQYFISSNNEALNLMKRCVKHFKDKPEFRSHEKFIKIWIKISEMTIEADDIFKYMCEQEIGTSSALLYKEWARHHEIVGNLQRADEIYTLGINRNADPVEELKQLQSQFDWRQIKKKMAKGDDVEEDEEEEEKKSAFRLPLNNLSATKSGKVNSKRNRTKLQDITSSHGIDSATVTSSKNRKCSSASVFEILDERDLVKKESTLPSSSIFPKTAANNKLPFHDNKENVLAVERMKNNKIKSSKPAAIPTPSKPSFFIFRDDETMTSDVSAENCNAGADDVLPSVTLVSRKPLNSITSQVLDINDMLTDLEQGGVDAKIVCVYPKDRVYMGNSEFSLEELRAQMNKYKQTKDE